MTTRIETTPGDHPYLGELPRTRLRALEWAAAELQGNPPADRAAWLTLGAVLSEKLDPRLEFRFEETDANGQTAFVLENVESGRCNFAISEIGLVRCRDTDCILGSVLDISNLCGWLIAASQEMGAADGR